MSPVMSILVPTRNRSQYAVSCVRMLLRTVGPDVEVVVSDNSTDELTVDGIAALGTDPRLVYVRSREKLTVHENFTRAFEHSSGEYVGFMGDDDGVAADVGEIARWARAQQLDAVVGPHLAIYLWPDVRLGLYGQRLSAALRVQPFTGAVSFPDARAERLAVARRGGIEFGRMPRSYHGIVARRCLHEVKARAGRFFPGPTPDMASAAALAQVVNRYAWIDAPIFISGTGMGSAGGAGAAKRHDWTVESAPWISPESVKAWSALTPRRSIAPTLWAEGVLQGSQAMHATEVGEAFNFGALYGNVAAFHWEHRGAVREAYRALRRTKALGAFGRLGVAASAGRAFARAWVARLQSLVENALALAGFPRGTLVRDLDDVEQACVALNALVAAAPPRPFSGR